ncbi:MAG: RIP metalloprotease RseP [Betaproteobacteria bacterium]
MSAVQTVLAFLAALTVLIFIHELGHYLAARWCGVKVLRFSIGFGPALLVRRLGPDRTEWVIAAIPLGGYVRMLDERDRDGEGPIAVEELHRSFSRRPLAQRAFIVVAGPLANFLLAIALYSMLAWMGTAEPVPVIDSPPAGTAAARADLRSGDRILAVDDRALQSWNQLRLRVIDASLSEEPLRLSVDRGGDRISVTIDVRGTLSAAPPEQDPLQTAGLLLAPGEVLIGSLVAGEPAALAGLQQGDRIVAIDGAPIVRARQVIERVREQPERTLAFTVERGKDEITVRVRTAAVAASSGQEAPRGRIGAMLQDRVQTRSVSAGPVDGLIQGFERTWEMSAFSVRMLGKMLTGDLSLRNLSGPVTIADMAGNTARSGLHAYIAFLALISVSLGVLNLLPIPILDGGHLVYYALEAVRRRPLSERFLELSQKAGLALVLMMMAVALYNDFSRLIGP